MKRCFLLLALLAAACSRPGPSPEQVGAQAGPKSVVAMLREQRGELTDWQKLTMAIAFTESRCNPQAVGNAQDAGILQLVPIYVQEVNRISGASYRHDDAFSIEKSLEMFALMQDYYNPSRDREQAIYYHNKSPHYRKVVLENLDFIERYEAVRRAVVAQ